MGDMVSAARGIRSRVGCFAYSPGYREIIGSVDLDRILGD